MKKYESPFLLVSRLTAAAIATVSTEDEWKDDWDDAMADDTAVASDEA
ncbi:MAG: hypothetical protein IJ465_01940 [Clostridia bacterium]|nr:hypothetical protein [Clostridia bacterium]